MRIKVALLLLLGAIVASAQTAFVEHFDSATLPSQWTCSGAGLTYNPTGKTPGFYGDTSANSYCVAPFSVGTGNLDLRFNMQLTAGNMKVGDMMQGQMIAVTTGTPGSMTSSDDSLVIAWGPQGLYAGLRSGEILAWGTTTGSTAADTSDLTALIATNATFQPDVHVRGYSYQIKGNGACPRTTCHESVDWPWGSNSGIIPQTWQWWGEISRDSSNNITFNIFNDHFKKGTAAWMSWTVALPSGHTAKSYAKVAVLAGGTANTSVSIASRISDIYGWAGFSGTVPTITSVIPTTAGGSIQTGQAATIIGTGFNCTSDPTYAVHIGSGSTATTTTASCTNSTHLSIAALPAQTNNSATNYIPYSFQVQNAANIIAELPNGILYHAPTVYRFAPYEVPASPANSADATIDVYGSGFKSTTVAYFNGNAGTTTYIDPSHIQVIVPSGTAATAASPTTVVVCTDGTGSACTGGTKQYDSANTFPFGVKLNFGYVSHPYMWLNSSALTALRSAFNNSSFANYKTHRNNSILTPGPFTQDNNCPSFTPPTCNNPAVGTAGTVKDEEYLYHYLESNDSTQLTSWLAEMDNNGTWDRIDMTNQASQFSAPMGEFAPEVVLAYDTLFLTLTPTRRAQMLDLLDRVVEYYNYEHGTADTNFNGGASNRLAWHNGTASLASAATVQSHFSLSGYSTAASFVGTSSQTELGWMVTQENKWGTGIVLADGGDTEGALYVEFGGALGFARATDALIFANTVMGTNSTSLDQGLLSSNVKNLDKYFDQAWSSGTTLFWDQSNDVQPAAYGALMPWVGYRFSKPLMLYLTDYLAQQTLTLPDWMYYEVVGTAQESGIGGFWAFYWRQLGATSPTFSGLTKTSVLSTTQRATLRSQNVIVPDLSVMMKGANSAELGQGHKQPDEGSIQIQSRNEGFIIDPGYNQSAASAHSIYTVDGNSVSAKATAFDTSSYDDGNFRAQGMDVSGAFPANVVTTARRTELLYANSTKRAVIILDDIVPVGAGAIASSWQAGQTVSTFSSTGFTMTGSASNVNVVFNGPSATVTKTTNTWGSSWVNAYEGNYWATMKATYTAAQTTPMLTMFFPANSDGTGALTATVNRTVNGVLTINFSDGGKAQFIQNSSSQWVVDPANMVAPGGSACTITTSSLPAGTVGAAYLQPISTSGCTTSTFTISSGALPTGLTINSGTGVISGTPTTAGNYTFTVAYGGASKSYTLTVTAAALTGPSLMWSDRRPIGMVFMSSFTNRSSINPYGYNGSGGTTFNATTGAVSTLFASAATTAINWMNNALNTIGLKPQGIICWDCEGQEFGQPMSYLGDPRAFLPGPNGEQAYNPHLAAVQAFARAVISAGYRFGVTLRPQHITFTDLSHLTSVYGVTPGATCSYDPTQYPFEPEYVVSNQPYLQKYTECTSAGTYMALGTGQGRQQEFTDDDYDSVIAELQAKIDTARRLFGATLFYVDSTVWHGAGTMDENLWGPLAAANPDVLFVPEEHTTGVFQYAAPFSDPVSGGGAPEPSQSSYAAVPTAFFFLKSDQGFGSYSTASVATAISHGQMIADAGTQDNPSAQPAILAAVNAAKLLVNTINVTNSATGVVRPFSANAFGAFTYPVKMRVYFAANSAGLTASTTYCDSDCTLDLSTMTVYEYRLFDFEGNQVARPGVALNLN